MSATTSGPIRYGVARNFFCEHSTAKSRVLALVALDGNESLRAVLTCGDRLLAERTANLLSQAANGGSGDWMTAEVERVAAELPDAPAASLRQALQHINDDAWPIDDPQPLPTYDDVHNAYGYELTDDQPVTPWQRDSVTRTPSDARLEDLAGPVFRVINMWELHVYDPNRLFKAAKLSGWAPLGEDQNGEPADEMDDLLDAAMALAGLDADVPGADIVTEAGHGEHLEAARGDQVSDWSEEPVTVSFGTGWRLRLSDDA